MFLWDRLRPTELRQWESPGLGYIFCKQGKTFLIMLKQYYPVDSLEEFSLGGVWCAHMWRSEVNVNCLPQSPPSFLRQGLSLCCLGLTDLARVSGHQASGTLLSRLPRAKITNTHYHSQLFTQGLGTWTQNLMLVCKPFVDWAISPNL